MEEQILNLLMQSRGRAFSLKEISKMLDREQFREDPSWARAHVSRLCARGLIQKDSDGRVYWEDPGAK